MAKYKPLGLEKIYEGYIDFPRLMELRETEKFCKHIVLNTPGECFIRLVYSRDDLIKSTVFPEIPKKIKEIGFSVGYPDLSGTIYQRKNAISLEFLFFQPERLRTKTPHFAAIQFDQPQVGHNDLSIEEKELYNDIKSAIKRYF